MSTETWKKAEQGTKVGVRQRWGGEEEGIGKQQCMVWYCDTGNWVLPMDFSPLESCFGHWIRYNLGKTSLWSERNCFIWEACCPVVRVGRCLEKEVGNRQGKMRC